MVDNIGGGRKRVVAVIAVVAIVLIASLAVVLSSNNRAEKQYSVSVEDALGRNVTMSQLPTRVVSCEPSVTEMVYALGFGQNLVGVSKNCDYPSEVADKKASGALSNVGPYNAPSLEAIVNCTPDLVILDKGVKGQMALLSQLETLGINVLVLYESTTVEKIFNSIQLVGDAFDKSETAQSVIADISDRISVIRDAVVGVSGTMSASYLVGINTIWVGGMDTFANNAMSIAGCTNTFANVSGWVATDLEALVDANPDVLILTASMTGLDAQGTLDYIESDPVWSEIDAVKNNKVYMLTDRASSIFSRPSVTIADCIELLALMAYPEKFGTTLPQIIGDDYQSLIE